VKDRPPLWAVVAVRVIVFLLMAVVQLDEVLFRLFGARRARLAVGAEVQPKAVAPQAITGSGYNELDVTDDELDPHIAAQRYQDLTTLNPPSPSIH